MISIALDPDLWYRVCIKATSQRWPTGDAWLHVRCVQYLKGQDSAGGGTKRATVIGPNKRRFFAKQGGIAKAANMTPEARKQWASEAAHKRWARARAAKAAAVADPEQAAQAEAARAQALADAQPVSSAPPARAYTRARLWPLTEE